MSIGFYFKFPHVDPQKQPLTRIILITVGCQKIGSEIVPEMSTEII